MGSPNTPAALQALSERLGALQPARIDVEATGGYETAAVASLGAVGLPGVVVNPGQVRAFPKATSRLPKTDRVDALVIALFGERVQPVVRPLTDEAT